MPIYFFNLKTNNRNIRDSEGEELANEAAARKFAENVARELMKRRAPQSRSWRIDVRDGEGRQRFELLFASIDESIMALGPELREAIENVHRKQASLIDAICWGAIVVAANTGDNCEIKGQAFPGVGRRGGHCRGPRTSASIW